MARYNRVAPVGTTTGAGAFVTPDAGQFTTLGGTSGYTVTLANPTVAIGQQQTFFNSTSGNVTLATPSGTIAGPGFTTASSVVIPTRATYTMTSDGVGYIISNNEGGPQIATTLTASGTITAQAAVTMTATDFNVTLSPAGTGNVTISPSGTGTVTMSPNTAGSINNVNIGASTRGTGAFTSLAANAAVTMTGGTDASSSTVGGVLTVTGGIAASGKIYSGGGFNGALTGNVTGNVSGSSGSTTGNAGTASAVATTGAVTTSGTYYPMFVASNGSSNQAGNTATAFTFNPGNGTLTATIVTASSDARLKENVKPITGALALVNKLEGVLFNRIGQTHEEIGVIAQQVEAVVPQLVFTDEEGMKSVAYANTVALLIEAIKEQQVQIEELKKKVG
jgi:hypothetical protein